MADTVFYRPPVVYNEWVKQELEATRISRLWNPRPKPQDDVRNDPAIQKRIQSLLDYEYTFDELKFWFRLNGSRAKTNTVEPR